MSIVDAIGKLGVSKEANTIEEGEMILWQISEK